MLLKGLSFENFTLTTGTFILLLIRGATDYILKYCDPILQSLFRMEYIFQSFFSMNSRSCVNVPYYVLMNTVKSTSECEEHMRLL